MGKVYLEKTVLEATKDRLTYIFNKFDHIVVAFSGGKDSGLLLELVNQHYLSSKKNVKVSVYHIDYEGNYQCTLDYVSRCMGKYDYFSYYHVCMPLSVSCGVSMYQSTWLTWDPNKENCWFRSMPEGAININNNSFNFFYMGMSDYDFQDKIGKWLHEKNKAKRTAVLVGIRAQESLNRYHSVTRSDSYSMFGNINYSRRVNMNVFNFYPLYDWETKDIWIANSKFKFDYNRIYDLFFLAGVPLKEMRVANPFNDWAVHSLKLFKVIDPNSWAKLVGRVTGANFAAIYGGTKAIGFKKISLPKGHTWKTYVNFLLKTLPAQTQMLYLNKFRTSIDYWTMKGGNLPAKVVRQLENTEIEFENLGEPHTRRKYKEPYEVVRFKVYPDDVPLSSFRLLPSYKRMCITILKNDTVCRYMGFSQTKSELQR